MTPKQERFVQEYLIDANATQAAIRSGYSEKTAYSAGQRLLKHVEVVAALAKAQAARVERVEITQDYVLNRLKIEAEREGEGSSHAARVSALEKLGKTLAMFTDKTEHSGGMTVNIASDDADL